MKIAAHCDKCGILLTKWIMVSAYCFDICKKCHELEGKSCAQCGIGLNRANIADEKDLACNHCAKELMGPGGIFFVDPTVEQAPESAYDRYHSLTDGRQDGMMRVEVSEKHDKGPRRPYHTSRDNVEFSPIFLSHINLRRIP